MKIIGAGMAGLIAAAILRNKVSCIYEHQNSLPNNHHAVLRFRSSIVGDTVNIPFERVQVLKQVLPWRNPVADALSYSKKVTGQYMVRSITSAEGLVERYIAPPDFVNRLYNSISCEFRFGNDNWFREDDGHRNLMRNQKISTIPMPFLMKILRYGNVPEFKFRQGFNIIVPVKNCAAYATLYSPDPMSIWYRASLTGNILIIECMHQPIDVDDTIRNVACILGINWKDLDFENYSCKEQKYMKILPIDEGIRRRFIMWASDNFGIYSLGRFATWRPGLQLDDLVNDVRVIQRISSTNSYDYRK
jgi:hypothetical protein